MKYAVIITLLFLSNLASTNAQEFRLNGAEMRIGQATSVHVNSDMNFNNSILTQNSSSTISITGDWSNQSSTYNPNNGIVEFSGSYTQLVETNNQNFANLSVSKTSGTINIPESNSIITNSLTFNSNQDVTIFARGDRFIQVNQEIERLSEGHIDGNLRLFLDAGNIDSKLFAVGYENDYTPIDIDINGVGGVAGLVNLVSNTLTLDAIASQLDPNQWVERQYEFSIPIGSDFDLGDNRTFDMTIGYEFTNDIRNGANSNTFETQRWDGSQWSSTFMTAGTRTDGSVQSLANTELGTFIVGPEAPFLTFYSIASGSWSDPQSWSIYDYYSLVNSSFAPRSKDIVKIGNNRVIDLDTDIEVNSQREIRVEKDPINNLPGQLNLFDYVIGGSGTFTLTADAILNIGSSSGITNAPEMAGNIQTVVRNYNLENHDLGDFIYSSTITGVVGNGLPTSIKRLRINTVANLDLVQNISVAESASINSGTLSILDYTLTGANTFTIADDATLAIGGINSLTSLVGFQVYDINQDSYILFNGTDQDVDLFPLNFDESLGFGNLTIAGTGQKIISNSIRVRGVLDIKHNASLNNLLSVEDLLVQKGIFNQGELINSGSIRLSQLP